MIKTTERLKNSSREEKRKKYAENKDKPKGRVEQKHKERRRNTRQQETEGVIDIYDETPYL